MQLLDCADFKRVFPTLKCCEPCHKQMQQPSDAVVYEPLEPIDEAPAGFDLRAMICCGMEIKKRTKDDFELAALGRQEAVA